MMPLNHVPLACDYTVIALAAFHEGADWPRHGLCAGQFIGMQSVKQMHQS
eukprot:CAMPEP_0206002982 /NCGR_PEP_ID=MMETSP1464-20131121/3097_1 /ASSEMBLY_ACC=CAM_ASM_001124 /TAXON_ID=119497 /ORGANISM="Exanthemachrysis gayraliae, Strain RCC1523" /LENGTH=49 /DNA_ID=CAMNT_0053376341 /DNA_START=247 /DNA_END=396 /DNA_ORIENTATION=+